jgi:dTDP-4-amino-4,6-dideoxygalactose transaminase
MVKMFGKKKYPVSTTSYKTGMSLPSSFLLTEKDQDKVIREVRNFYGC